MRNTLQEEKLKDKFENVVQDTLDWPDKNQLAGRTYSRRRRRSSRAL